MRHSLLIAVFAALVLAGPVLAARDMPGDVFHITPADMPEPYATDSVANGADTVPRKGRVPDAPEGFRVQPFADNVRGARKLIVHDDGRVFVARSRSGTVMVLWDTDGDSSADLREDFMTGLSRPHGMAIHEGALWVADTNRIYRAALVAGEFLPRPSSAVGRVGMFGSGSGHWTRNIVFSPDGRYIYAAVGSRGNIEEEPPHRAAILRFEFRYDDILVGSAERYASGLRNPVGIAFMPGTDRLFAVVNERDGMGDGLVPDYFTEVREGAFYGWPYAYIGPNPQPGFADRRPDLVAATAVPDVLFQSHSAPIDLTFLADADVPDDWRDDALVTFRGSWNAAEPTGYKVVRVEFEDGKPTGRYINFLTGFRIDDPNPGWPLPATVWGRPVGVAVGPDGAIYVSDEIGSTIWRVTRP